MGASLTHRLAEQEHRGQGREREAKRRGHCKGAEAAEVTHRKWQLGRGTQDCRAEGVVGVET